MAGLSLNQLVTWAREGNWVEVDKVVPVLSKNPMVVQRAIALIEDKNEENLRDLGASIIEKANISQWAFRSIRPKLANLMNTHPDGYDGFRAACALVVHDPQEYKPQVINVLKHFSKDTEDSVRVIAQSYLTRLA